MNQTNDLIRIVRTAHDWRVRLTEHTSTPADEEAFAVWLAADPRHEEAYARAETLWDGLGELSEHDYAAALKKATIGESFGQWRASAHRLISSPFAWIGAATVAAAFAFTGPVFLNSSSPEISTQITSTRFFETTISETATHALEDGTRITLGAASELKVEYSAADRSVLLLSGNAFFEVASNPSRPFRVQADDLNVRVTGTSFEVSQRDKRVRVAVAEGSVRVQFPLIVDGSPSSLNRQVDVTAGQKVEADPTFGLSDIFDFDPSKIAAWREDRLIYDGDPLSALVSDANRYSVTPVQIEEVENEVSSLRIRGAFSGREVDEMLSTLPVIHPIEIDRSDPDQIIIRSKRD